MKQSGNMKQSDFLTDFLNQCSTGHTFVNISRQHKSAFYKVQNIINLTKLQGKTRCIAVADRGFPVGGGVHPLGGAWTSDVGTFW